MIISNADILVEKNRHFSCQKLPMVNHRSVLVFQTCVRKIRHSTHVAICTSVIPEQIVEARSPTSDTCHKLIGLLKEVRFSGSYALLSNVFSGET